MPAKPDPQTEALVKTKMAAGLPEADAREVVERQKAHDAALAAKAKATAAGTD
jgi:hypothetical protein